MNFHVNCSFFKNFISKSITPPPNKLVSILNFSCKFEDLSNSKVGLLVLYEQISYSSKYNRKKQSLSHCCYGNMGPFVSWGSLQETYHLGLVIIAFQTETLNCTVHTDNTQRITAVFISLCPK